MPVKRWTNKHWSIWKRTNTHKPVSALAFPLLINSMRPPGPMLSSIKFSISISSYSVLITGNRVGIQMPSLAIHLLKACWASKHPQLQATHALLVCLVPFISWQTRCCVARVRQGRFPTSRLIPRKLSYCCENTSSNGARLREAAVLKSTACINAEENSAYWTALRATCKDGTNVVQGWFLITAAVSIIRKRRDGHRVMMIYR